MDASGSDPDGARGEDVVAPLGCFHQIGVFSRASVSAHYQSSREIAVRLHADSIYQQLLL
jgi:hypothetical protein